MKRRIFSLRWDRERKQWELLLRGHGGVYAVCPGLTKKAAIAECRVLVRKLAPSQLRIFCKNGRIRGGIRADGVEDDREG